VSSAAPITPTAKQQANAWDASFEEWRPGPGNTLLRAYSDAVNRKLLGRWLPLHSGSILKTDLFDEVVGTGLVGFLLERADRVSGIDVAPSIVAEACRKQPRLEATVADVRSLPYPDETFDVVVSTSTLDHFESRSEIVKALGELARVLRPGGSLVVTLDNSGNPLVALRNALPQSLLLRTGLVPYPTGTTCDLTTLRHLVASAGLHVEDVDAIMHVPRLAVRAAAHGVAGNAGRADRLISSLIATEPPGHLPLRTVSGQFVAVHARRPGGGAGEPLSRPEPTRSATGPLAGGPRAVAMRALGRTVYRRLEWLEQPLLPPFPAIEARVPIETGFLGEADLDEIVGRRGLDGAEARARFARGDRCFGARHEGRLVAANWIATGTATIDYLGLTVALPPRTAYRYDTWTDPHVRGLHIAPAVGSVLCRELALEGIDIVAAAVLAENRRGMYVATRAGFRPAGVIGWVGVGPVRRGFRRAPRRG
jgi:SAM-dependent methyltransferase